MPATASALAVSISAAAAGSTVTAAAALQVAAIGIGKAALSVGISSLIGRALQEDPPSAQSLGDKGRLVPEIRSTSPYKYVVGRDRVAGTIFFRDTKSLPNSEKNELFYEALVISASEISEFEDFYVNDSVATLTSFDEAANVPYIKDHRANAEIEFPANPSDGDTITLDGQTYTFRSSSPGSQEVLIGGDLETTLNNLVTELNSGGQPGRIDDATYSAIPASPSIPSDTLKIQWDTQGENPDPEFDLATSQSTTITTENSDDKLKPIVYLRVERQKGSASQIANTLLLNNAPNWTSDFKAQGRAIIGAEYRYDNKPYPEGKPKVSTVVKGVPVYDPRESSHDFNDSSTWEYSDNAALIAAWYLYQDFGFKADENRIDWDLVKSAANVCDESVSTVSGSEKRYRCWGIISEESDSDQVREELAVNMAGDIYYSGGKWRIYAGAYRQPTESFDESDLADDVIYRPRRSRSELINTVRGTFVSEDDGFKAISYPEVQNQTALDDDNGQLLVRTLDLPFCPSHTQAQRIAHILINRSRQQKSVQLRCNLNGFRAQAGDSISLSLDRFNLVSETFLVNRWQMSSSGEDLEITLDCEEDDPTVYDQPALKSIDAPGNSSLPAPEQGNPQTPTNGSTS